jgi:hypothetical protein
MGSDLHPIAFRFTQDFSEAMFDWLFPFIVIFIALFFTPALESIRLRLARVDISTRQFEEFSVDISNFVFRAERIREYFRKGWTSPEDIEPIIDEYYQAITKLRSKELVYQYWEQKYWKEDQKALFQRALAAVKEIDRDIHTFYDSKPASEHIARLEIEIDKLRRDSAFILSGP